MTEGRTTSKLSRILKQMKIILLDVDGVLTDGSIILLPDGDERKIFNVKDGTGIVWAGWAGLTVALITGRQSSALEMRAKELGVKFLRQRASDKVAAASEILESCGLAFNEAAAMGDDFGDIALLQHVALPACPSDAHPDVARLCLWKSKHPGGHGAVREFIEKILRAQKKMPGIRAHYGI